MKCSKCGAWSSVRATRSFMDDMVTRRERICANLHKFTTYEVHGPQFAHVRYRITLASQAMRNRWSLWARNQEIKRALKSGMPGTEAAVKWNVSTSLISLIKKDKV